MIGATSYIRHLRGREQRLIREVILLRSKLSPSDQSLWESEWGNVDDHTLADDVEDFTPPDDAFVDIIDDDSQDKSIDQPPTPNSDSSHENNNDNISNAPRYLLGMFLSFGLLQKPYNNNHSMFRRSSYHEGNVLSSSVLPDNKGIDWKDLLIPDLKHPYVHDIIQTILIVLTLLVLLYPLLPNVKTNPFIRVIDIIRLSLQKRLNLKYSSNFNIKNNQQMLHEAERQIYEPQKYTKLERKHTNLNLLNSQSLSTSPKELATLAIHSKSPQLWKDAQMMKEIKHEPKYVSLALDRSLEDGIHLCSITPSQNVKHVDVLQKISINVSKLALEELWGLKFIQVVNEEMMPKETKLITKAISQLMTSTEELGQVYELVLVSGVTWSLFQQRQKLARDLCERLNGKNNLKCVSVLRMIMGVASNNENYDEEEEEDSENVQEFKRCDEIATITILYFTLQSQCQSNNHKHECRSLYHLSLRLRSLLANFNRTDNDISDCLNLIDRPTFDNAIEYLQLTGHKLMGFEI